MKANSQKTRFHAVSIIILCLTSAIGALGQTFTNLYTFPINGAASGLVPSGNVLYGVTEFGGVSGQGSVFSINTDGTGFTTLYSFSTPSGTNSSYGVTNTDGANPAGTLVLSGTTLYGTAVGGGSSTDGTVFRVNTDGSGFTNLHNFSGADGVTPLAGVVRSGNTLYGTTWHGGIGAGNVFAIKTDGSGFQVLYAFTNNADGFGPIARLAVSGNVLYGTTQYGGSWNSGTIFAIDTDGTSFTNLHNFSARNYSTNSDGANLQDGLTVSGGTLYGIAAYGGAAGNGTIFKLNTDGSGFSTLYNFSPAVDYVNADGELPLGGLVLSGDTLYGTADLGGTVGDGTVFQLKTDGTGFLVLHTFAGGSDGYGPAGVTLSENVLYGISFGSSGHARMFSLTLPPISGPPLGITLSAPNVILTWPTNVVGFTLQSTPSLTAPAVWTPVYPAPVVVNGLNTVTNPMSGGQQFYRLSQ
jgi:uncharacterized repeat protein (TIGR03803 family)